VKLTNNPATIQEPNSRHSTEVADKRTHPDEFPFKVDSPREMTDFGGNGQGAAVAECELNLPHSNKVTLTSSDLNELGCTTSTSAKSTVSSSGVSSGASSSKSNSDGKHRRNSDKSAVGVLSIFRKSRSVSHHEHARRVLQENRSRSRKGSNEKNAAKTRRARSSSRIFIEILRTLSKGFSSCRSDRDDHQSLQKGERSASGGRRGSRFSNNHVDTKGRRKSHDASHDGTNGSDSTSTGYVSDSSNEKHDHEQSKLQNQKTLSAMSEVVPNEQTGTAEMCPSKIHAWAEKVVNQLDSKSPEKEAAELEVVQNRVYVASSCSEEDFTEASDESFYTSQSDSVSSDYESTSTYDEETDEKEVKHELKQLTIDDRNKKELGIIKEEDEKEINEEHATKKVKRRKSTLKRKKTMRGEEDLNKPIRKKAALKVEELDNISRSGSLKDMILQFETTMAELNIHADNAIKQEQVEVKDSPLLGVKAIARRIQEQTEFDSMEVECMPPSQILKLKQALDLEPKEDLSQPVPLSRRSESKVAQIARQIADAERERQKLEKAMARSGKSPKASKRQQSTSFINELLEMARAENSAKNSAENASPGSAPDFKQSLLAARKKITQRDENLSPGSAAATEELKSEPVPLAATSSTEGGGLGGPNEVVDPFVKEVLTSKNVPEPVKQKIRIECWSLFNDPRTPKGVKQCILATMLSKVQNE